MWGRPDGETRGRPPVLRLQYRCSCLAVMTDPDFCKYVYGESQAVTFTLAERTSTLRSTGGPIAIARFSRYNAVTFSSYARSVSGRRCSILHATTIIF